MASTRDLVLAALEDGPATAAELSSMTGKSTTACNRYAGFLADEGLVLVEGRPRVFSLADGDAQQAPQGDEDWEESPSTPQGQRTAQAPRYRAGEAPRKRCKGAPAWGKRAATPVRPLPPKQRKGSNWIHCHFCGEPVDVNAWAWEPDAQCRCAVGKFDQPKKRKRAVLEESA